MRAISGSSIFPKLVLIFIAVTLPLFALSLVLNELAKQEVRSQISDAMRARLHYEVVALEQELERILSAQQKAVNDADLLDLTGQLHIMTNYRKTETINRVSIKITDLKESSGLIAKIGVYLPELNRVISTWGVEADDAAIAQVEAIAAAYQAGAYPVTEWNGRLFLHLSSPGKADFHNQPPAFVHQIELSVDALKARMSRIADKGSSALYGEGWTIVSDGREAVAAGIGAAWLPGASENEAIQSVNADGTPYLAFYEKSPLLESVLAVYIPEDVVFGKLKSYRNWFWLLVVCSLVMIVVFSYGIFQLIQRPLSLLVRQFRNVEEGNFNTALKLNRDRKDEFGYLFQRFGKTVQRLKQLIDELYVQKIRSQQSELKQLQAQIAPHFLYNSFFTLNQLIKSYDIDKAEQVSKNLGAYFQYVTRNGEGEVPLGSEADHVRAYMEIQGMRFSNRIEVKMEELSDKLRAIAVPRLILQPIVENVYHHGLRDIIGEGRLSVSFLERDGLLRIEVRDNGKGLPPGELEELRRRLDATADEGETTGIVNVHRRLRLRYGPSGGVSVQSAEPSGLLVTLTIPIEGE
ncbi:histidine kinase [Cohnella sp. LGH]|uniref:sensor histidine kinase n=1 Tax=Cohnella sp. LGH TaxID=1619153 RepID=UPI001ADB4E24|nr:histidine kinase [Cohnella sp. LGH]QTH43769.1 histidine kinase [Cohnella sp. LGH]